jgi:hypothetical protein
VTTIVIDRSIPTVEIEDHEGEVRSYGFRLVAPGIDQWAVELTRLDNGQQYHVALTLAGSWFCDCPDAKYRARKSARLCKHQAAARDILVLVRHLSTKQAEAI